ncbi:hypothetical protein ACT7DL_15690 [Bacillus paranthracis]
MAVLKDMNYIEKNTYNEIGFFKGILWGLVFVVPFLEYYDSPIYLDL